jgi:hypothetical protein
VAEAVRKRVLGLRSKGLSWSEVADRLNDWRIPAGQAAHAGIRARLAAWRSEAWMSWPVPHLRTGAAALNRPRDETLAT